MPKRMTRLEIYCTSLSSVLINVLIDVYLDMHMHLYNYFDPGIDYVALIYNFAIFPPISTIFLNYFPFSRHVWSKVKYLAGWTCFALGYEFLSTRTGVLTYSGWHLWYSAFVYPAAQILQALNLAVIRKWCEKIPIH